MNTYLEGNIKLKDTDNVEVSLLLYNKLRKFTIGLSNKNKYSFLFNSKDYFGNGCQYESANDCVDFIKNNFREQIRNNYKPYLCVNGKEVDLYINVSQFVS